MGEGEGCRPALIRRLGAVWAWSLRVGMVVPFLLYDYYDVFMVLQDLWGGICFI